ncbi:MAG: helix-turn-helix transcriptional regulator [Rhodoferax sp.]|nr:helix-turn-helix transcriptional regulator [Rhodoferax sp.]
MPRANRLRPVRFDDTVNRSPSVARPVRSRARSLAMDTHIEPHQHPWSQFTYCASGLMQVTVLQGGMQTTFIIPSTRAVWIPPEVQHTVVVLEAAELRTVDMDPSVLPRDWTECRVLVVSKLLRELIHALEGSEVSAREDALMALTADEVIRSDTQALGVPMPHPEHGDKRLRALCEAVLRDPAEKAQLKEWVAEVGASERTVARLFRDELGTSYQQWRLQAVLAHALPQLARGVPIAQVAAASGYASDSAFSAMFKQAMGRAPSHFQRSMLLK